MKIFGRNPGKKGSSEAKPPRRQEETVLVLLEGTGSAEKVYQQTELAEMAAQLKEYIERNGLGEFGGNEFGPTETTLFMYGPDAERLFNGIEPILRGSPLCRGARVLIRPTAAASERKEIKL